MTQTPRLYCIDCKWHHEVPGTRLAPKSPQMCAHINCASIVDKTPAYTCNEARSTAGPCGPTGSLYEPKEPKP